MGKTLAVNPARCTGCSMCALTCSFLYHDEFNLTRSNIRIKKHDFEGIFQICFLSTCRSCLQCAEACPSGALRVVNIQEAEEGGVEK